MNPRADMPEEAPQSPPPAPTDVPGRKRWGCLTYLFGFFILFFLLLLFGLFESHRDCVVMPNGFLIGPAVMFSSMMGPDPDIAIKYPDGRIFSRGDENMDFWDHESFAGNLRQTPDTYSVPYVYLNDGGLILQSEQPDLYRFHYERKSHLYSFPPDSEIMQGPGWKRMFGGHVYRTYSLLYRNPANRRKGCPTAWAWPRKFDFFPHKPYIFLE